MLCGSGIRSLTKCSFIERLFCSIVHIQRSGFSSSHVQMWELGHKEGRALKNWFFQTMVLVENSWRSLGLQGDQTSQSQRKSTLNIHWKDNAEVEAPVLWPHDAKSQLTGKDTDAGEDWRQEEKGMTEDEMVGWHYQLNGHEFEQTPGESEGQGRVVCCSSWGHQELDTT